MTNSTATTSAKLFVTDYASYNAGLQFVCGEWFDLEDYTDADSFYNAIEEHYKANLNAENLEALNIDSTEDFNISDLELMFTDFEGFPDSLYSESMNEDDINNIITFANLDENEREKINAFIECFGGDLAQALDKYEDAYQGEFKSDQDFAEAMAEQCGFEAPNSWPYNCIDWERAARDLMFDYSESNGHYFCSNW